ncbi:hypothetical protein GH733_004981 [Mirounga leonina]|nr:hypothetical protein GH733_004981 [Mirounga leonina]
MECYLLGSFMKGQNEVIREWEGRVDEKPFVAAAFVVLTLLWETNKKLAKHVSSISCIRRWANLYFLFLVILNWMPSMEVFHREITMLPLAIVLFIIMVKDGMEDFKRHRFDREINCSNIWIYERRERNFQQRRQVKDVRDMTHWQLNNGTD